MTLLNQNTPHALSGNRVRAVILDWAGTTLDFGSLAPVRTLERVFAQAGIQATDEELRQDMGIAKREHIAAILNIPRICNQWLELHGHMPVDADVARLYEDFLPLQFECLSQYSQVIQGVPDVVGTLRGDGIRIGSTTGYTRAMLDVLVHEAAQQGYSPDCSFAPEDAGGGRPLPFMIFAAAIRLQVYPLSAIVKVGDTESDIAEALNAGTWAVGVAGTGNGVGLSQPAYLALDNNDRQARLKRAKEQLQNAGAHYVIETLAELPEVIQHVNAFLAKGTRV